MIGKFHYQLKIYFNISASHYCSLFQWEYSESLQYFELHAVTYRENCTSSSGKH